MALLQKCGALLRECVTHITHACACMPLGGEIVRECLALLRKCRALLEKYGDLLQECGALLRECGAAMRKVEALLPEFARM